MEIIEALTSRRSIGKMTQDVPSRGQIEQVLGAAVHAPNHYDTQPWRFFVLSGEARNEFGDALAEALRRRYEGRDEPRIEAMTAAERAKPLRSPVLVVVGVAQEQEGAITARENLQAASAAMQNMLLAANALGMAAIIRTGDGAYDDSVKAYFGLRPADDIAGIVYLGYPDLTGLRIEERVRDFAAVTQWRGPLAN